MLFATFHFKNPEQKRSYCETLRAKLYADGWLPKEVAKTLRGLDDESPYVAGRDDAEMAADLAKDLGVHVRLVEG
jgi:hypothetical protein